MIRFLFWFVLSVVNGDRDGYRNRNTASSWTDGVSDLSTSLLTRPFVISDGYAIEEKSSFLKRHVETFCACRRLCLTSVTCKGFSSVPEGNGFLCLLTSTSQPKISDKKARSGWKLDDDEYLQIGKDRRLYFSAGRIKYNSAIDQCSSYPGFRLGIYKTQKELQEIKRYLESDEKNEESVWVNLNRRSHIWGDGTSFKDTELSKSGLKIDTSIRMGPMVSDGSKISDGVFDSRRRGLCQSRYFV